MVGDGLGGLSLIPSQEVGKISHWKPACVVSTALSLLISGFSYSRLNILVKEVWGPQELRDRGEDVFSEAAGLLAPDSLTYQSSQALF